MLSPHTLFARRSAVAAAGLALVMLTAPVQAKPDETVAVRVRHVNLQPQSQAQARTALNKLSRGAMEACGASPFSVAPHRQAVRDSTCWKTSMADAVGRIDNKQLTAAYQGSGRGSVTSEIGDTGIGR